jgi:hypothetical protein
MSSSSQPRKVQPVRLVPRKPRPQTRFHVDLAVGITLAMAGCAGSLFHKGPRPPELAGLWADSALATPTDTVAWVFLGNGTRLWRHTVVRHNASGNRVIEATQKRAGSWYFKGRLTDSINRQLCSYKRARDWGTCVHFSLDSILTPLRSGEKTLRRRLVLRQYAGGHSAATIGCSRWHARSPTWMNRAQCQRRTSPRL